MLIYFRLVYIARGADMADAQLRFRDTRSGADFSLSTRAKDEKGYEPGDEVAEAECQREVPDHLVDAESISTKNEIAAKVHDDLDDLITRTVLVARWRVGNTAQSDASPIRLFHAFRWSRDRSEWNPVKDLEFTLEVDIGIQRLRWDPTFADDVEKVVLEGGSEPLGHQLFREAYELRLANGSSAVVMAVAAAEIGFKRFATRLAPDTTWLLAKLQSPPLDRMLKEWLPLLLQGRSVEGVTPFIPRALRKRLNAAVELRNDLVHEGGVTLDRAEVRKTLEAVRDLLYLLDVYSGITWAGVNVGTETTQELKDEAKKKLASQPSRDP